MSLPPGYSIRTATPADADLIAQQREAMFVEAGHAYSEREAQFARWVVPQIEQGRYLGWLIEHGAEVVAGAGLLFIDWPPHFMDPQPLRSYLLNVYTSPAQRGRGLARSLTRRGMEESRSRGIRVMTLHASVFGKPLYEQLGFVPTNEMRLTLDPEPAA